MGKNKIRPDPDLHLAGKRRVRPVLPFADQPLSSLPDGFFLKKRPQPVVFINGSIPLPPRRRQLHIRSPDTAEQFHFLFAHLLLLFRTPHPALSAIIVPRAQGRKRRRRRHFLHKPWLAGTIPAQQSL